MRKLLLIFLIIITGLSFIITDAEAKRFGGGKNFGMYRSTNQFSRPVNSTATHAAKPASTASKWLGPLAGLALGGLLASLFMGHGLGTGILSWILLAGVIFLIWRLLSTKLQSRSTQHAAFQAQPYQVDSAAHTTHAPLNSHSFDKNIDNAQTGFDDHAFLRHAKSLFIRLQAAYDDKNISDIREFTSPEVFAEIQLQLQERNEVINQTDVIHIDAQLLDLNIESQSMTASVRFSGSIREQPGQPPEMINEIWHFIKENHTTSDWVVAGIQQE